MKKFSNILIFVSFEDGDSNFQLHCLMLGYVGVEGFHDSKFEHFWHDFKKHYPNVGLTEKELKILFHCEIFPNLEEYEDNIDEKVFDFLHYQLGENYDVAKMRDILEVNDLEDVIDYKYVHQDDSTGSVPPAAEDCKTKLKTFRFRTVPFSKYFDNLTDTEDEEETTLPLRIQKTPIVDKHPGEKLQPGFIELNSQLFLTAEEKTSGMKILPADELLDRMRDPQKCKQILDDSVCPLLTQCVRDPEAFKTAMDGNFLQTPDQNDNVEENVPEGSHRSVPSSDSSSVNSQDPVAGSSTGNQEIPVENSAVVGDSLPVANIRMEIFKNRMKARSKTKIQHSKPR